MHTQNLDDQENNNSDAKPADLEVSETLVNNQSEAVTVVTTP